MKTETNLVIQETYLNVSAGYIFGETEPYETYTNDTGELFRSLRSEYGKCISKIYIGEQEPVAIGWVFEKRNQYTDTNETYLQETWVTLVEQVIPEQIVPKPLYS